MSLSEKMEKGMRRGLMLICENRPVEIHQLHIKPSDFFSANPSIDVPSNKNLSSTLVEKKDSCCQDKLAKEKL